MSNETPSADAQGTFDKAKEEFPAKKPEEPCIDCADECKKCQDEMKKALQGKLYDKGIGNYSAQDLNDATITTFGELSALEAKGAEAIATQQRETEGIASLMYNRHNAELSGNLPKDANFTPGKTPNTLSGIATRQSQFHGYKDGKALLRDHLTKGKLQGEPCRRQCQRWRASKKAVEKFASDPAALEQYKKDNGTFYWNRAVNQRDGMRTLDVSRGEVRIGGTDFSSRPMGTDATPFN